MEREIRDRCSFDAGGLLVMSGPLSYWRSDQKPPYEFRSVDCCIYTRKAHCCRDQYYKDTHPPPPAFDFSEAEDDITDRKGQIYKASQKNDDT